MRSQLDQHYLSLQHCWACGAANGAYDEFLAEHLTLCFSEPTDVRFPTHFGFQIVCSACLVGPADADLSASAKTRWYYTAQWPGCALNISM